jgi:glycosyltransferase involved in cell wall biosynthesis
VRLGWIGSHSTVQYLEAHAPVLEALLARHPRLRLLVIGATSTRLTHPQVEFAPWTLDGEIDALARADIGLAPLPDSEWARGKCGLKLLQYQALAIPVVASPVGVHPAMIEDGVDGFLAADDAAWQRAIERLVEEVPLRRELGQHGRAHVEERYSVRAMTPRLLEALAYAAEGALS